MEKQLEAENYNTFDENGLLIPIVESSKEAPAPAVIPAAKIYWTQTILGTMLWGVSTCTYKLLDKQDFAVSCLSWTGFLFVYLVYKLYEVSQLCDVNKNTVFQIFFGQMAKKLNRYHLAFRSINFIFVIWLTILMADYSQRAEINFGIILSLNCVATAFQVIIFWIMFGEKLSKLVILGIIVTSGGTALILISKTDKTQSSLNQYSEEERMSYLHLVIFLGMLFAFTNLLRLIQAKFISTRHSYSPNQFTIDAAFICGIIQLIFSIYYFSISHPSYTWNNIGASFVASSLTQISMMTMINAIVKGLSAPTIAITNTGPVFSTLIIAVFQGLLPNVYQTIGMALCFAGVMMMILCK
ncbi:UNKNOWN [Stylonychia lemnae]|uniref:EamA domain-containing protein n=1 Tax=Stylonychia lemnae TaxID=5949 RepID=A0A077ZYU1_STYLE|nr:UNKNOWN [Stylonychia lemnae]|eukprot:CDW75121.1 UNKNOWN [Stylonychia lemnae]